MGWHGPATGALYVAAALFVVAAGAGIALWLEWHAARRRQAEWEAHLEEAVRVANAGAPYASRAAIQAAHLDELEEGSRLRHPARRRGGAA